MNRTKQAISDAFWELLEEKPYNKITVNEIAERCHINRNTFYYHFPNTPALAEYTIREWTDKIIKINGEVGSPLSCIKPLAEECMRRKKAFLHLYRSVQREAFMRYLNIITLHLVTSYVNQTVEGSGGSDDDRETLVWFNKCLLTGIILDWLDADMSYDVLDFFNRVSNIRNTATRIPPAARSFPVNVPRKPARKP